MVGRTAEPTSESCSVSSGLCYGWCDDAGPCPHSEHCFCDDTVHVLRILPKKGQCLTTGQRNGTRAATEKRVKEDESEKEIKRRGGAVETDRLQKKATRCYLRFRLLPARLCHVLQTRDAICVRLASLQPFQARGAGIVAGDVAGAGASGRGYLLRGEDL